MPHWYETVDDFLGDNVALTQVIPGPIHTLKSTFPIIAVSWGRNDADRIKNPKATLCLLEKDPRSCTVRAGNVDASCRSLVEELQLNCLRERHIAPSNP